MTLRRLRAIAGWSAKVLAALLLAALLLVLGVSAYLGTKHGRARLSAALVTDLSRALPGSVSLRELERFSLTEVVLRGVALRAPAGNDVLMVERVRARLSPASLLRARVVVTELSLEDGTADLRFNGDARRSLTSALLDPQAAAASEGGRALALVIENIKLERWRVRLPARARFPARELELATTTLRLEASSELRLDVDPLEARLIERDREVGAFSVRAHFRSLDVSRLAVDGALFGMPVGIDATFGAAGHAVSSWKQLPFALELRTSELTRARLRQLTASRLALPALEGPIGLRLALQGNPEAFDGTATVETPGGPLTIEASVRDLSRLQLQLRTEQLALRRLLSSLPDWHVASEIALSARRERDGPARVRLESTASTRIDGHPLPQLTLRAERDASAPWRLELGLDERWMSLSAQGSWAADGTGHAVARSRVSSKEALALVRALGLPERWGLPAASDRVGAEGELESSLDLTRYRSGNLDARATPHPHPLQLGNSRLEQLSLELTLAGALRRPQLHMAGHWRAAPRGSPETTPGRLELDGGPQRYRLQLSSGALGFGSFAVSGRLEREGRARRFALTADGRYGGVPWRVAIAEARLLDTGQLSLQGAKLELCEQRFLLHGHYAGADSELVLDLDDVDVGRLLRPFRGPSELTGSLSGRLEARGDLKRPELQLELRATRWGLGRGATLDAQLDASLDARRGLFQLRASARESATSSARSNPRLDVTLEANGSVDASQPWPRSVAGGEQRARIGIEKLDSAVLGELVGAPLPVTFDLHGSLDVDVRRGIPTVATDVGGRLDWAGDARAQDETDRSRSASVRTSMRYAEGRAETELSLSDRDGPWVELHASLQPFDGRPPSLAQLVGMSKAAWMRQLAAAAWRVDLDAKRRSLAGLPSPTWLGGVSAAALGARLVAHRDLGRTPAGELTFDLAAAAQGTAPSRGSSRESRCSASPLTTQGKLSLDAGRYTADIAASDQSERKLHLTSSGELDVSAWLSGRTPKAPRIDVSVDAAALPLDRLPFVCDELRGELTAQGRVRDVFGHAEASGDVRITRFSLGSDQTLDVNARLALDTSRLELAGDLLSSGRKSSFRIHLPRAQGSAKSAREAAFELSGLPLAPLVPLDGPISHASGHVSGSLRASAGAGAPQLSGNLRLDRVGLTVTELAQPLSDINGELRVSDGALVLKRLSARDGEGKIELNGQLKLSSARSFDGKFELVARKFPLRQSGEVVAQTTATAKVDAAWRPEHNRLRVELKNFDTWLERREPSHAMSLAPHPDLHVTPAPETADAEQPRARRSLFSRAQTAQPAAPVPLTVQIDASRQFWVKRADFAFKLSADLDIDIQPAAAGAERPNVSVKGQLEFDRGYMEMMGKTFEVKSGGLLRFTGGTSAVLDLMAQYDDRRSSQRVVVHLQGSVTAPKLDFSVDGEKVSAGEAFQAIYGSSKTSSEDDVKPEAQASQIISALMAGVLTTSIRRKLGSMAPILSVDPADEDRGDEVRAGFELDTLIPRFLRNVVTGVYVEGSVSSEKQSQDSGEKDVQTGVLIELYFPYDLVTSGRYGPDTTWSFDVGWQPRGR